jgi:hypothetical protein
MPLFACEQCGCIENTATGCYWGRERALCSECGDGKWHERFPKKSAEGMLIDQLGHLWSKSQVDAGQLPSHYKIVGTVGNITTPHDVT